MPTRVATASDVPALAALINAAYIVERFFKTGDRISETCVAAMQDTGAFLILEREGLPVGSVYVEMKGERGYLGLLSVDPAQQRGGAGRALMHAAEDYLREHGAAACDLRVVNLREELPGFYRRFGYAESGTEPFSDPNEATRPCHFILMSKSLTRSQ